MLIKRGKLLRGVVLLVIGMMGAIVVQAQESDKRAEALKKFLEARKLDESGDYPAAVAAYKAAVALDPTSADLRIALGSLYLKNRNIIDAESQAREAIKLAPDNLESRKLLARVYLSQTHVGNAIDKDKVRLAIKELEEIAKVSSSAQIEVDVNEQLPVSAVIGELYLTIDETDKALESFKRVSEGGGASHPAYYRVAQIYYQKNKFREATAAARRAYDAEPKNPAYASLLGKSLLRTGRSQEAVAIYEKAVVPRDGKPAEGSAVEVLVGSPLTFDYAEALVFAGRYDDAVKLLDPYVKTARRGGPVFLRATELIADAQRRAGKREDAVRTIEDAIKGQDVSESLPLLYNLAETFEEMQQFAKAVETYDEALQAILNPDGTVSDREPDRQNAGLILRRITLAYRMDGKRDKVLETVERMRKALGPKSTVADQVHIGILVDEGKFKEALDAATAAIERHPDERVFKLFRAQASGRLDDMETAEATLRKMLNGNEEDIETYLFLSSVQLDANRLKEAEESARKAVAIDASDIGPLLTLSTVQERQKKYKESEATLRKALEIGPDNPTVLNNLGYFLADRGERLDEAEELIRRAVNIEPTNGSFLDSLGWLLYKKGKTQEAQKYMEQAVIYSPRSVTIRDHMGDVYKKLGMNDKARAEWEMALKLGTELRFSTEPNEINRIKEKLGRKK
jgi:tetratricopeptide (TPR) repeat protein